MSETLIFVYFNRMKRILFFPYEILVTGGAVFYWFAHR